MVPEAPRPGARRVPPPDSLGRMCQRGRDSAPYLRHVPGDEGVRREMGRITLELETALTARSGLP